MEHKIIEYYKQLNSVAHKKSSYSLTKQLFSGSLKVYKDYTRPSISETNITYAIIISGIWETSEEIGITYKVVESSPIEI
jgi:exopolysaccharide biosynthesis protein